MTSNPRKLVGISLGVLFFTLIIIFGVNRFGRYITGPEINEISINEYTQVNNGVVRINGTVNNTSEIFVNSISLPINEDSGFSTIVTVPSGHSQIAILLNDTFENSRAYTYNVYNTEIEGLYPPTLEEATTPLPEPEYDTQLLEDTLQ
ncbi:MAG: hypothetical protein MRY57_01145 [Candidatus Pacebacteria bacterium]|nr:hypothetical protein [Candidatus Paceibacterota bacterium]